VLADLVVLAVDAAEVAIPKEDVARAASSGKGRLFAEMWRVSGDDRIGARPAGGEEGLQTVVAANAGAVGASRQKRVETLDALRELTVREQIKVSRFAHSHPA